MPEICFFFSEMYAIAKGSAESIFGILTYIK
jgi:hypothetical protein